MPDLFSTNVLNGVVADLKRPSSFLLDRFFPNVQTETSEEIHFDVDDAKRRLAPFVSPLVEGKVVAGRGYTTNTFKPAYIKDKRVFDANRPLKRSIGEQIGGSISPMDRLRAILAFELEDMLNMLTRRLEVMSATVLRTGAVTIVGDNYPSVSVNFGRDGAQTIVLTSPNRWSDTGVNPLNSLQDWAQLVLKKCGAMPTDVVMDVATWKVFRANAEVQKRLDLYRAIGAQPTMQLGAQITEGGVYMGSVDGFNIFVYSGWYIDDAGVEQPILPSGTVIMSGQLQGVRAYGAIRDEAAGFQAVPYYVKSWVEEDPAVRFVMMQSAPLVVPYRVNASLAATVL
jgi:hypothetical protein